VSPAAGTALATYRVRGKEGKFSDMKVGGRVNIGHRMIGGGRIPDRVTIERN
jgi:hypothetical protein